MLKNVVKDVIMTSDLRWNSLNNNVLISTAMLNALWEKKRKDTLDILIPFLKYAIARSTKVGKKVDIDTISGFFINEYGYETMPNGVILTMMNRLSPNVLKKKKSDFFLIADLSSEVDEFDRNKSKYQEQCDAVISSLQKYLNDTLFMGKYDEVKTLKSLMDFFVSHGICIVSEPVLLEALKTKDSKVNYCIAQFIIRESKNDTPVSKYLIQMVEGFFVSSAISLQPENGNLTKAKYKGLTCYLDTRIILCALGLHLPDETKTAKELLKMLQTEKADIRCFEHTFSEICDIINAYKYGIINPSSNSSTHTLEAWDELNYTVSDVKSYYSTLRSKIERLGITIVPKPSYDNENCKISEKDLSDYLGNNIVYRKKEGLEKDIDSISAIVRLRNDLHSTEIEKCGFIFITTNIKLSHYANSFVSKNIKNSFPAVITDVTMASITWLKSYSINKDFPKKQLLTNALTSIEPSSALITEFLEKIDKIQKQGGITVDEAAVIRSDLFCRREASRLAMGDPNAISDNTVYRIRDDLKKQYSSVENKKAELNYKLYKDVLQKKNEPIKRALQDIENSRESARKKCVFFLWTLVTAIFLALLALIVNSIFQKDLKGIPVTIFTIIASIFEIYGAIDILFSKKKMVKKIIEKLAFYYSALISDNKKKKYLKIFSDLNIDTYN